MPWQPSAQIEIGFGKHITVSIKCIYIYNKDVMHTKKGKK